MVQYGETAKACRAYAGSAMHTTAAALPLPCPSALRRRRRPCPGLAGLLHM